jgi:hypothetical protein
VWGGDILFIDAWPRIESSVALIRSGHEGKRDAAARYPYLSSARRLGAALPDHAVLLLHSVVRNLGFDREVLLDTVGKQGLIDYDKIADPRGMWELYRSLGITHVAHLWGLPSTHNRAHDVLFIDFITRWAQKRERFGQWELVTVPDRAPPPERPYQVLCLGINYEDGLYGIEQMRVHEIMQPYPDPLPPPKVPLPPQEEAQRALMLRANAVVVGVRYRVGPELKQALNEHFREGVAYPKLFAIWVRR